MVRDYELMYIVRPDLDDDGVKAAMDSVQSIVETNGGEVVKTTPWGKRRLAYEIQKLRDGHYVLLEVRLEGARIKDIERTLRIHDQVFRHMVVTRDHAPDGEEPEAAAAEQPAAEGDAEAALTGGPTAAEETPDAAEAPVATADADAVDEDAGVAAAEDEDEEDS